MSAPLLATLPQAELDEETRNLLGAVLSAVVGSFDGALSSILDEFEREIFALADGSRAPDRQKQFFDTVRETRRAREYLLARVAAQVEDALARFTAPDQPPGFARMRAANANPADAESAALAEIAHAAAAKFALQLAPLAQRLGHLGGVVSFTPETLPIGPYRILEVLRLASVELAAHAEHRLLFYRVLERHWLAALKDAYDQCNRVLASAHFAAGGPAAPVDSPPARIAAPPPAASAPGTAPVAAPVVAEPEPVPPAAVVAEVAVAKLAKPPEPDPPGTRPQLFLRAGAPDLEGLSQPLLGWPVIGLPQIDAPSNPSEEPAEHGFRDVYFRCRELLAARRRAVASGAAVPGAAVARADEVQLMLAVMSDQASLPVDTGQGFMSRSFERIRVDLINQLRQSAVDGKARRLSETDADTFTLLGLLFDQLSLLTRGLGLAHTLLVDLRLPILRAALLDKRFFTQHDHPARQLLGAVVEHSLYWCDPALDPATSAEQVTGLVEHIGEFKGSNALFEELLAGYVTQQRAAIRRAELVERRQVEAASGRDRLQAARREAEAAIARCLSGGDPPEMVRQVLEQDWPRLLALTILSEGGPGPNYRNRLAVAGRLIALFDAKHSTRPPSIELSEQQFLRRELEAGLAKVGYQDADASQLAERLIAGDADGGTDAALHSPPLPPVAQVEVRDAFPATVAPGASAHFGARDRQIQVQLGARCRGAWMDFVVNRRGDIARRKLAWINSAGDRCLIVNQRGTRVEDAELVAVAHEIRCGRARVVPAEVEGLADRALRAVAEHLRAITPGGAQSTAATSG